MHIKIDISEVQDLTKKLKSAHKSAFPLAIRGTLNDAAFDMKQATIPIVWDKKFIVRKKSFIKSHTGVKKSSNTFNINAMIATVGIKKGKSKAGDNLEKQEFGGVLGRRIIPGVSVRIKEDESKLVSKLMYYNKFRKAKKGQVLRTARKTIIKTDYSLLQVSKGGKWKTLYRLRNSVTLKKQGFMQESSKITTAKINNYYMARGRAQLERLGLA